MRTATSLAVIFCLLVAAGCATTALPPVGQQTAQTFTRKVPVSGRYLLYLPDGYREQSSWPLLLFLHGAGERGDDLDLVKIHGPPKRAAQGDDLPFIIVSPQVPTGERWTTPFLDAILNEVIERYRVDEDRIYVTGLSMGGFGTWDLAMRYPHRFAAIAPVCGGGTAYNACVIRRLPVWNFHGAKDNVVPIARSEEMVEALKACGGDVTFTVYPDAGHDAWTETYDNPELYAWLLRHRRQPEE